MKYTDEQIERANQRSIVDYFSRLGYKCERRGRDIKIHGFGGLCVNPESNKFYIHSRQTGGMGLIDCLMKTQNLRFPDAVRECLDGEIPYKEYYTSDRKFPTGEFTAVSSYQKEKHVFTAPKEDTNYRRLYAYLTKRRCISSDVVNEFVNAKLLYQDKKGNCVFLHKSPDNTPCGAELHGTGSKMYTIGNTVFSDIADKVTIKTTPLIAEMLNNELADSSYKFTGYVYPAEANIIVSEKDRKFFSDTINKITPDNSLQNVVQKKYKSQQSIAPGTSNSFFQHDRGEPVKAYVFESAIDLMSFIQLHPEADNCKFVSMAGLKPSAVEALLSEGLKVVLCVDNDKAGLSFCKQFAERCTYFSECKKYGVKDFNELLCKKKDFKSTVKSMAVWADGINNRRINNKEPVYAGNRE